MTTPSTRPTSRVRMTVAGAAQEAGYMSPHGKLLSREDEALLSSVLMVRLERGTADVEEPDEDVEAQLVQAGEAFRSQVRPLDADELIAAVRRLQSGA